MTAPDQAPWTDRTVNALAASLAWFTPLTPWFTAGHHMAIRTEQLVRRPLGSRASRPAVHWHEGGRGPALVMLNGLSASGLLWPTTLVDALERDHRVIRVDNRGTGLSRTAGAPFTVANMADDVRDVLEACGEESAIVLGMSLGGVVAQEVAIRHPQLVKHLLLLATVPPLPAQVPPRDVARLLRLLQGPFDLTRPPESGPHRRAADTLLALTGSDFEADDLLREEIGAQLMRLPTPWWGALQQARAVMAWRGPRRLTAVAAPTTVLSGADDPVVPVINGRRITHLVPDAEHVILAGVGHLLPWEAGPAILESLSAAENSFRG